MKIAITGATGFIGSFLIDHLIAETNHEIVSISRSPYKSHDSRIECRQGDLYSLLDCEKSLAGCDVAVYLVHSMLPSSRLSQGTFKDFDFILADNFARACKKAGVKKIIYISGLIPDKKDGELSEHLKSRLEVERTLSSHGVPCTTLRCGIVLGFGGSSFRIVENLVKRLPVIALPNWTQNLTQSVYIGDLVKIISDVADQNVLASQYFDVGIPEEKPYSDLLKKTTVILDNKNIYIKLSFIPRWLSKLWVRLISGQPKELVYPLIDSLVHSMTVSESHKWEPKTPNFWTKIDQALRMSLDKSTRPKRHLERQPSKRKSVSLVQSVQRLPAPREWNMKKVAHDYLFWLPNFLWPFLLTTVEGGKMAIRLRMTGTPLLVLELSERSSLQWRELFYIRGGVLAKSNPKARLEFRSSPQSDFFIVAIHSFEPALPWFIYRYTQALMHAFVMYSFGNRLRAITELKEQKTT